MLRGTLHILKWLVWDFSGLHFIFLKILPPRRTKTSSVDSPTSPKTEPPTFLLWVMGVYFAAFGISSQRYENKLDQLETRVNVIVTQAGNENYKTALELIPKTQQTKIPVSPSLLDPSSVFSSLFGMPKRDEDTQALLARVVSSHRQDLSDVRLGEINLGNENLNTANMSRAKLDKANLANAQLQGADLTLTSLVEADLSGANLKWANLREANLSYANISKANLVGANLTDVDLSGADLRASDLTGAFLTGANLSHTIWTDGDTCIEGSVSACRRSLEELKEAQESEKKAPRRPPNEAVFARVIDSGSGLCVVVRMPGDPGNFYMVYDTGSNRKETMAGIASVVPGSEDIDLLILSHGNVDHTNAALDVFEKYTIRRVFRTGLKRGISKWHRIQKLIRQAHKDDLTEDINLRYDDIPLGHTFEFGETSIVFLAGFYKPPATFGISRSNDNLYRSASSIVIRLEYNGKSILFASDIRGMTSQGTPTATERFLVENAQARVIKSNVLIAPHHGSSSSSSMDFIKAVSPEWVIFSAGHRFALPRAETVTRYINAGVRTENIFRTDRGDDEGQKEWEHGRIPNHKDPPGDDHIDILLPRVGQIRVSYLNP